MSMRVEDAAWVGGLVLGAVIYHYTAGYVISALGKVLTAFIMGILGIVFLAIEPTHPAMKAVSGFFLGYAIGAVADPEPQTRYAFPSTLNGQILR